MTASETTLATRDDEAAPDALADGEQQRVQDYAGHSKSAATIKAYAAGAGTTFSASVRAAASRPPSVGRDRSPPTWPNWPSMARSGHHRLAPPGVYPQAPPIGVRNRALLLLGLPARVPSLRTGRPRRFLERQLVNLRRSKTDRESPGRRIGIPYGSSDQTCPVLAVRVDNLDPRRGAGHTLRAGPATCAAANGA
ncbi:MAG: hypothetical protein ACR2IK_08950 [Chloroflexota bacterium]